MTVYEIGLETCSLSTFYSRSIEKYFLLDKYLSNFVRIQNIRKIMDALDISDPNIEDNLPKLIQIYEEKENRRLNEAYAKWRKKI